MINEVKKRNIKFIVITGGVCSSIGKGVLLSSLAVILKKSDFSVSVVKWDPYLNVDPGTMSPLEHGEVFVTADGAETDLDLGHYERLIGVHLTRKSSVSSGQIYEEIIRGERGGAYLGKCIQVVPHVVDATKRRLLSFAIEQNVEFVLLEIGGTVGDIEGTVFLEAIRQLRLELGASNFFHGHLSYVPVLGWSGEVKTKPTQHSVATLMRFGLVPDALFLRAESTLNPKVLDKVAVMCGIAREYIFQVLTFDIIYKLFIDLDGQQVGEKLQRYFNIQNIKGSDLREWRQLIASIESSTKKLTIGLVAKYVGSSDPYISVIQALKAAGFSQKHLIDIEVIDAELLEKGDYGADSCGWTQIKSVDGIVVPGGFDKRGALGKILAARWAREHKIPYFGLCLGLQMMLVEFARSVLQLENADSAEFVVDTSNPVIALLEEQKSVSRKGATMRLGTYPCMLVRGTKAYQAYQADVVHERHRHRYEFNNTYKELFEKFGMSFSGIYQEKNLVEIAELNGHPFMLGTQFHPEFTSVPLSPNPLFKAFIKAIIDKKGE